MFDTLRCVFTPGGSAIINRYRPGRFIELAGRYCQQAILRIPLFSSKTLDWPRQNQSVIRSVLSSVFARQCTTYRAPVKITAVDNNTSTRSVTSQRAECNPACEIRAPAGRHPTLTTRPFRDG